MAPRRGRPRRDRPNQIADDQVIALSVDQLIMWGFSGQGVVFETVGSVAKRVLKRYAPDGKTGLGPDRVKKLWEQYRPPGWERYWPENTPHGIKPVPRRSRYTKQGLQRFRPDPSATVQELAAILLENGGVWPNPTEEVWNHLECKWETQEVHVFRGEPELSPKWAETIANIQAERTATPTPTRRMKK